MKNSTIDPGQGLKIDFDPNKVNSSDASLGTTSAVGAFPSGASPYGLQDMSCNIWEWTRTIWDMKKHTYPYKIDDERENVSKDDRFLRVIRGGAFNFDQYDVRCAFRRRDDPLSGDYSIGFRIVVSPFLHH